VSVRCPKCATLNADTSRFCGGCGTSLQAGLKSDFGQTETLESPVHELRTGATFADRYQIVEELGKGGMGKVYKAIDTKLDEEVALKLIQPGVAADPQTLVRFRNELKLARKISHKNIGRMYELLEDKGTHYITMEYISGQDLKGLIRQTGRLTPGKSVAIACQIAEGLAEAHRSGVVHRDLKPGNIMIDRDGNARIMDFGIARSVKGKGITSAGTMIGTPEYMSPEQVEGKEADGRSDIYSLGVLLFEMTTGRLPFESETPLGVAHKHAYEPPPDPTSINPEVSAGLSSTILRCLEKDPDSRPQKAEDVLALLAEIDKGLGIVPSPAFRSAPRAGPAVSANRRRWILPAATGGVLLTMAALYLLLPGLRAPKSPVEIPAAPQWKNSIAVLPFSDSSPGAGQRHLCTGMTEAVSVRLSKLNPEIKVTSSQSAVFYQDQGLSIQDISQRLDVKNILHGTVQREGDRLRVTAQLINAADESVLWSDMYNGDSADVLDIQDDISMKIAEALTMELAPDAGAVLKDLRPRNLEAYEYYMKGMHFLNGNYIITFDERDFLESVQMFEKAVEIDPAYMMAYFGLGWAYEHHYYATEDPADTAKAREYARKCYALDPGHPKSLAMMAYMVFAHDEDHDRAFAFARKAIAADPNDPQANFLVGVIYQYVGLYNEGITLLSRAMALDPNYFWNPYKLGMCYLDIGDFENSIRYFEKYFEVSPKSQIFPGRYIVALIKKRSFNKAGERIDLEEQMSPGADWLDPCRAILIAAQSGDDGALAYGRSSEVYSLLGMKDEAIASLKNEIRPDIHPAYLAHPYLYYILMLHNPHFDNIRNDPRFAEILAAEKKLYEAYERKYGRI
jgi:serine/threonine protein kinase/tetratricopeptide (TPR) repeat protein